MPLHFLASIGSTNDVAVGLAAGGAAEGTLVVADCQTKGRGRGERRWQTRAGTGLAMSLILRPRAVRPESSWGISVVGALAVAEALETEGAEPAIKWPNDVLLEGCKVAGMLVDASWEGERLQSAVLGIGVNVLEGSAPPEAEVDFPATSIEAALGRRVDRSTLLLAILEALARWVPRLGSSALRQAWWQRMAYRDGWVSVEDAGRVLRGRLVGLDVGGGVRLRMESGEQGVVSAGAARLRPIDKPSE